MKKLLPVAALLFTAVLTGCAANGAYVVRYGPPPPPRYGIVGMAPGPGYAWTEGYWDWRGGNWFWVGGAWLRPPRPRAVWVPGYWRGEHGRYRFYRGHWR
jgi:hypothetical protein